MSILKSRRRLGLAMTAAGLAVAFVASGCGASSNDSSAPTSAREAGTPADGGNAGAPLDTGAGGTAPNQANTAGPAQAPGQDVPETRSIIYTGTITVRVAKVDEAALKASAAATGAGGFVGGDERSSNSSRANAKLILRVPADKFSDVLNTLHDLGTEESRSVSTQDVTEQIADVDARIANAQASVERVRALMARAQTIGEITALEAELSRREGDLESLKARKRKLDDLTALSTITVVLLGPDAPGSPVKKDETGFLAGLKSGWSAFLASMQVLLTIVGALVPWLVALGIPLAVVWWLVRRSRRNRPVVLAPATAGGGPAPAAAFGLVEPPMRTPAPAQPTPTGPAHRVGPPPRVTPAATEAARPEAPAAPAGQDEAEEPATPAAKDAGHEPPR
jgi:hypothetical protein